MDKTLKERIAEDGITIEASAMGLSKDRKRATWKVVLHHAGREFQLPDVFEQREKPTAHDVLDLVCGVCNIIDQSATRDDWAREYTMDGDPDQVHYSEKDFRTWKDINLRLMYLLGPELHHEYLYSTDRSDG